MATEADLPEPIAKKEGEIVYPASSHFDSTAYETSLEELNKLQGALHVPPETDEYSGETKKKQAANDVGAEAMSTVIKVNVESPEGERFLGSPSAVQVPIEDTCRVSKNSEPEEVTLHAGNETLEDGKQAPSNSNIEVAEEIGSEESKVTEDAKEKPDENNMSHDIVNLTGTSLQIAQVEESNVMIEEESIKEERVVDYVGVAGDQHVLVEDKSNEKETSDIQNYEKDGTMTEGNTDLGSSEQVVNVLEAASDKNKEDLIHKPDPTVISLNKSIESVMEPCNKAESTIEGKSIGEEMRDISSTVVENKEAEKSSNLTDEVPGATESSERASGVHEAESEAAEGLIEVSSILGKEISQDDTEPSKDEMNNNNNIDTPAMQTEVKDIINKSPHEVKEQIEMTEKTAANDSTSNETVKDYESPDQKRDGLFMKDEDALSINEVLSAKEASFGGKRYEEEKIVTVTKDSITDRDIIDAFEHSQSGMRSHEDRPEDLQQDKPEKEKLEGSLYIVTEELNKAAEIEYAEAITPVKEETPIKIHEEGLDKEMKSNLQHLTDTNVLEIELDEKTECAEVEAPNKNANDLHDIQALDEEAGEKEGKTLDGVLNSEPKRKVQEAYEAYTEGEKHIEDAPEACQSSNSTIFDQISIEGEESTELIPKASETHTKKLQEASGLDFQEKPVIVGDGENTDQEVQKNTKACQAVTQEISANNVDADISVEVGNAVFHRDENAKQNTQVGSPLEVVPELLGQEGSCITEDKDKRNNIKNEEVYDGTKITTSEVTVQELVVEDNFTHISPGGIEKHNVENSECSTNRAELSGRENNREQFTEGSSIRCLVPESVEQGPVKNSEEELTGEVSEKSDTVEATESVGLERIKNIESPKEIVDASTLKGDTLQTEGRNLTPTEASPEEKKNEHTTPSIVAEETVDDFEPADVKDDNQNKTSKFEEDLKHISQKNEPGEELPQSLSTLSDKNEAFNSDADKTPGDVDEGPTQNLEEALQVDENEKETEAKNDTENSKTAMEQDLEKIAETSDASKGKECMASEPSSEMVKMIIEDDIKKEESEELYADSNDGGRNEETEKHNIKEECSTTGNLPEPIGEESLQSSKEAEKEEETHKTQASVELNATTANEDAKKQTLEAEMNVDQSREVEEEKTELSSKEDDNVTHISKEGFDTYISAVSSKSEEGKCDRSSQEEDKVAEISKQGNNTHISPLPVEQETRENCEGNANKADKSGENNGQRSVEEDNSRGLILESESAEQSPVKNLEADKIEADKSTEKIFENSETSGAAGSKEHETNTAIESTAEVLDTSQMKQGDSLQTEENQRTAIESSAEDKRNEDRGPAMMPEADSNENEMHAAKANIENKSLIGEEDSQHTPQENEPEENHEQSLPVSSDENEASKLNADKIPSLMEVLTSQDLDEAPWKEDNHKETEKKKDTEDSQIVANEDLELVNEQSDASKSTESIISELKLEKDQMLDQDETKKEESEELYDDSKNSSLREPTEDKTPQSFEEEGKEEETPITEVCVELESSVGEDAKKKITEGISVDHSKELEVEKVEQISKEDDITAKTSKQEECEKTHTANEDEDTGIQNTEKVGADGRKFELFARGIDNDDPLVKESEENEHDKLLYEDSIDAGKYDETEKQKIKEECSSSGNLPETIAKESLQSSKEDKEETPKIQECEELKTTGASEESEEQTLKVEKNVDQSREVDEEKIEHSSQEDVMVARMSKQGNDTYISQFSIEQETIDNSEGNEDEGEKTEGENNREPSLEKSSSGGLTLDSVEHSHFKNLKDDKMSADRSAGEILENSKISGVAEIVGHESNTTIGSTAEILDTSPLKQVDSVQNEERNLTSTEASAEEKRNEDRGLVMVAEENSYDNEPIGAKESIEKKSSIGEEDLQHFQQENEPAEKHECSLFVVSDENEPLTSNADKTPGLMEVETSQDIDEAPQKEENDRETEEKNDTEDNTIETKDHDIVAELSDASKSSEVLDLKSEEDKMSVDNEIKEEASKELYEETKNAILCDTEGIVQHSKKEASSLLVEEGRVEENSKEDESTTMKSKDQVDESNSFVEETEAASSAEETVSETLKDWEESKTNESLIEESSRVSHMSNKETEEEIKEKEGTTVDDSDSAPITVVTEEISLREAESEDNKQVESFAPTFEEKDIAEIETKETMLEKVDINVKPDDISDLGEKRDNEIPTTADKVGEITEGLIQESAMVPQTSNTETEEEIKEAEETTTEDSDSTSVAVVTEAKGLQEAESEKKLVESFGPAFEEKGIAENETKERTLEIVDINVKPEDTSELGVKRDREISNVAAEASENIDCEIQKDAPHAGSVHQSEEKNDTEDSQIVANENLEIVTEQSEASKSTESIVSELKSEKDQMLVQDERKKEESEGLYDDSKNTSLREPTEDKTPQSFEEEGREEETPITEVCVELESSEGEDAKMKITKGISVKQSEELEVEKVEQISKEDDITAKASKQMECEKTQTANEDEDTGSQNIEKGSADGKKFELFARGIDNDDPLVKESEENEHDKQLHEDSNDGVKDDETEKHYIKEECSITENLLETIAKKSLESSKEDEKEEETPKIQVIEELKTTGAIEEAEEQTLKMGNNVDHSREVEEEKIEHSSQESGTVAKMSKQGNDTYISQFSIEQETIEDSEGNEDKEEKTGENNREQCIEKSNSGGLTLESVDHSHVKNLEDDEMNEDKSTGEIFKNSKTSGVAEIAAHESSTTIESTAEILDTSLLKQVDGVQNQERYLTSTEASAEEKRNEDKGLVMMAKERSNDNEPIGAKDSIEEKSSIGEKELQQFQQENEPAEKHERLLFMVSDENEPFISNADKTPGLMEVETSQDLDEAPQKEENVKETEEKNDTEDNKIETKNHEIVAESSDASKSSEVLDLKSEEDKVSVDNEIKEEASKELYQDTKNAIICDTEDSKQDASSSLVEEGHVEENSKEDESATMKSKDQVDESNSFMEETEAASSSEKTVTESLKDGEESKTNGSLIEESSRVSHMSNKETEEEIKEKEGATVDDSDSAPITVVTEEKSSLEAESKDNKQVESFVPAFEEKDRAEIETKETMLEKVDINVKPDDTSDLVEKRDNVIPTAADKVGEITEGLIQESAMMSQTSNTETEEEIKETGESTTEDSDSKSVAVVTEAKGLQEAESEDKKLVESFGPASKEKGMAETETKERMLEIVDINVKPEDTSDLGEKRDREISKVAADARETIICEIKNDAPYAASEHQSEKTANDKPLEEMSKDELKEYCTMKSKENELTSTEVSELVDKPPAQYEVQFGNTETACDAQAKDDTFMNKQDDTTNPVNVSELESVEVVQKHKIEDPYVHPELDSSKDLSTSEDVEITKGEETGKTADQGDVCKSRTLKDFESSNLELQMEKTADEKPFAEALNTSETPGISTPSEKAIQEQETFKDNLKEVVEVEDAAVEQKGKGEGEALTEEVRLAETQTSKTFLEPYESKIEENSSNNQNQEDDKEIKEKEEPQLEAEEHKEQNVNVTTKAVILTEKKQDGFEQSNDSEDIKEMVVEEDRANELNAALPSVGETTDKMQDFTPVCSEEKTKTENPDVGEYSVREGAPSFARESEEQKVQDLSIELSTKEMKEKIGGIIEEPQDCYNKMDNASLTAEKDTSSGQAEIDEKLIKAFHIDSDEPCLEVTENENCQKDKEVDSVKHEEDNGHPTIKNRDAGEPQETKIAYEESKCWNAEEVEVVKSQIVENSDRVRTNNDDHAAMENAFVETEIVTNEANEIKEVSDAVYESKEWGAEEAKVGESQREEKRDQFPTNDDDDADRESVAMENSGADEADETKIISNSVDETKVQGADKTAETWRSLAVEKMDHIQSSNFEHAQKESLAVETLKADKVKEIEVVSDSTYESTDQDTQESAGEIPTAEKLDQVPGANSEQEEAATVQYPDAGAVEETKIASILACKSKDQGSEDIDVTGENTTEEKQDVEKIEEACKAASDYRAQVIEPVTENETTADRAPLDEKLARKHESILSVEKVEEEKPQRVEKLEDEGLEDSSAAKPTEEFCFQTEGPKELEVSTLGFKINKDLQDSLTEAYKEEGQTPAGTLQLEPQGIENNINGVDSSSESNASEKICNLKSETSEKALQSGAVIHSQEEVAESEDRKIKEKFLIEAITEVGTEENQSNKTKEANEITKTEASKEENTEDKEVAKTCQPVSFSEEGMNKSLQEDGQKAEEYRGEEADNAFKTTLNEIQEEISEETEKATASSNVGRQDATEDRIVEDSQQDSVENTVTKERRPDEFEGKNLGDSPIKLEPKTQGEESSYGSGKAEATIPEDEESSMEKPVKESIKGFAIEQGTSAAPGKQIPTEADVIERTNTMVQTGDEHAPTLETPQKAEEGDLKPGNTRVIPSEAKLNLEGEKTTEESAKASLSDILQRSTNVTTNVAEHVSQGREPTASTEGDQTKAPEAINVDEHKRVDSSSDAAAIIEAPRDMDVKVAHKKSHSILSGVGSKVKHSISKVKKAITCKSSHSKPVSTK